MATLALSAAGAAAGSALLPSGVSLLGASLTGAAIGQAVGASVGSAIDNALFGPLVNGSGQSQIYEGPRWQDLKVSASTEGAAMARAYGRVRIPGEAIWATDFEEEAVTIIGSSGGSGKGLGGGGGVGSQTASRVEYRYYANAAFALCEGEITRVGRIWADGKELNQSDYTIRVYKGTEEQQPDSLIESKEGVGNAPAYRGTAYIVFERFPLERYGRRLPQLNFEVFRAVDDFEKTVRAVTIIPSAGEFAYSPSAVSRSFNGTTVTENLHTTSGASDWSASMDQLEDQLPNVSSASLFISWFGDDLRAGSCQLTPRVDSADKVTIPHSWSVAGLTRDTASAVSEFEGVPAFGGTPSDASVVGAIQDLKARGKKVTFTPFILMDIPSGNSLPDPYSGGTGQSAYPWRGRITISPAPGEVGSPDKSTAAAMQITAFVGNAAISDFSVSGGAVQYSGVSEWSYRRMILHYAHLCLAAGGVDAFIIGTELRGLSWVRESENSYPFVAALQQLASDVKTILGSQTFVTYAADWSEYFGHQPADGTGDVYFHLDPLWSSSAIDAIGIDVYWPLSDWRDGQAHADRLAGHESIYDLSYLKANISGAEGYDWYYSSASDRDDQTRTPISDGAGKPWVFRYKDIKSWWENEHFDRPGGLEAATSTSWVPQSKPIWFTEIGCPAIDKGANQPNVFVDPKSSESEFPYYSRRIRDDLMQRRYLHAVIEYFDRSHADYVSGSNPISSVYSGPMVDIDNIYAYTWDARPYPAFPLAVDVWADGANWEFGHWLTGRMSGGPLSAVVSKIMADYDFEKFSVDRLDGHMDGYAVDRVMTAREVIQPLELAYFFDSFETGGAIHFVQRGRAGTALDVSTDDLVDLKPGGELFTLTRGQETELPRSAKFTYVDGDVEYRQAAVESRRLVVKSERVSAAQVPIVMSQAQARQIAESWLQDSWAARERATFSLPPSKLALEPGDIVTFQAGGRDYPLRLTQTRDGVFKTLEALSIEESVFVSARTAGRDDAYVPPPVYGPTNSVFMDLPILSGEEVAHAGWVAAYQSPWPGGAAFYRSSSEDGFVLNVLISGQATLGVTETDFYAGPEGRLDWGNRLRVRLDHGALSSLTDAAFFSGGNLACVQNADGGWEVFQFREATLVTAGVYDLGVLLRAQSGTEDQMRNFVAAGARFVLLDAAVKQVSMTVDEIDLSFNWKFGPSNKDVSDPTYSDAIQAFEGRGLRPFSPVHVSSERSGNDLALSWVRRTRFGGDSWSVIDVPVNETAEAYEVDILDGANVVRTLTSNLPTVIYSEGDQISDFGVIQSQYAVRVYQLSATYGRGIPRDAVL